MTDQIDTIFISHSHHDEEYVKELVNLLTMLHVPNIICSSYPGYHIPNDQDIYEYLKCQLSGNTRIVFVLSENYYESVACLNEMGACWVLNKSYTTVLTPNFEFKNIKGAINPNQISFKLNDLDRLYEFLENRNDEFNLGRSLGPPVVKMCEQAIERISQVAEDERRNKNQVRASIEGVRVVPSDSSKLEVRLRLLNTEDFDVEINLLRFEFLDENDADFIHTHTDSIRLHSMENRVFFLILDMIDTSYEPYLKKKENVDLRFSKYVW